MAFAYTEISIEQYCSLSLEDYAQMVIDPSGRQCLMQAADIFIVGADSAQVRPLGAERGAFSSPGAAAATVFK